MGIGLLFETHGILTDTVAGISRILDMLGRWKTVGINLDTGNCWLGGGDPLELVKTFAARIKHVHWKDIPAKCSRDLANSTVAALGTIPHGDVVVSIEPIVRELHRIGFDGPTTLEVDGEAAMKTFAARLQQWSR